AFEWIGALRDPGSMYVPVARGEELMRELLRQPRLPPLDLPEELRYEVTTLAPRLRLIVKPATGAWQRDRLLGWLSFEYAGEIVSANDPDRMIIQSAQRRAVLRDPTAEATADERLRTLGWRTATYPPPGGHPVLELAANRLPAIARALVAEGWHVEAEGRIHRPAGRFDLTVGSGVDWFELHGTLEFGDRAAALPELLEAVRRGESTVRLGDGTVGVLPEEWLKRYGLLAGLGTTHEDHVRFTRSQVGLLDALLATQPDAQCDAVFSRVREELREFSGVRPVEPPAGFQGELRPYQKAGLGWIAFLRRFGLGGCLADDMGLGKTVQVLALLEGRREERCGTAPEASTTPGPSLVVVPRSLIFNWMEEAARFTPKLRVLDHTGLKRLKGNDHFADYDLILTTYGTLRRDAADFQDTRFDYVILDEAQAIKNAGSASAKAARLLKGDHRLALSGTPIENHLGELWSLFEFLNPGMLGAASVFRLTQSAGRDPDDETRKLLAQALRPFLLRRTKEQVISDLPPKVEQTLYCELEGKQRKLYDELRDHYRQSLLKRIERVGLARSKIQILEALLRLRQAALHPGLLDKRRAGEPAAKLEVLLPRLKEALEEGHKSLVFSQFTSMLAILRERLDGAGIPYAYLDGRTRDREEVVTRFQSDPDCKLFLISLKAGGLGLNLTAAQYVFLLDPWWNPAVEAQAIDRAHRIGQTGQVFAYRLISRDTIEEKVLELQARKRDLAEAIVGAGEGLMRNLGREDLERLLS
ncbi:MAG: DEAD/DEAH box helicase, partial [Steroidobacteraceae bacterium]